MFIVIEHSYVFGLFSTYEKAENWTKENKQYLESPVIRPLTTVYGDCHTESGYEKSTDAKRRFETSSLRFR